MAYQPTPQVVDAGERHAVVKDDDARDLLTAILLELRILNMHMAHATELDIKKGDVKQHG